MKKEQDQKITLKRADPKAVENLVKKIGDEGFRKLNSMPRTEVEEEPEE